MDSVIEFSALDRYSINRVIDKLIIELEQKLEKDQITINLNKKAKSWIAKKTTITKWVPDLYQG